VIGPDLFLGQRLGQLAALALRQAVPAIYADRLFATAGGLMSYGGSLMVAWRLPAACVAFLDRRVAFPARRAPCGSAHRSPAWLIAGVSLWPSCTFAVGRRSGSLQGVDRPSLTTPRNLG
jgi:hypothetical protein